MGRIFAVMAGLYGRKLPRKITVGFPVVLGYCCVALLCRRGSAARKMQREFARWAGRLFEDVFIEIFMSVLVCFMGREWCVLSGCGNCLL